MRMKLAAAALVSLSAVACAEPAPPPATPATPAATPPPAQSVAQTTTPSDALVAPGKWKVERVRCSDLLGAADDDREAAVMFYYGYLAAKAHFHVIDVSKIGDNISKVMRQCSVTPTITVPEAFRRALGVHTQVKHS